MVPPRWFTFVVVLCLLTVRVSGAEPPKFKGQLPPSEWSPADQALVALRLKATDSPAFVFPLWPMGNRADDPQKEITELLPEKPDGLVRVTSVSRPTMHLWRPRQPDGRAVIIFPGGGYNALAAQHEGTEVARWLNEQGVAAFIVKYRVPRRKGLDKHAVALQDAQRAIRIVRSRAEEFDVAADQIGVLGFSAGGHLATATVHQADSMSYQALDEFDRASARPDFAILIYPAYLVTDRNGSELDPLLKPLASREKYPPIFLAVAADDAFVGGSLHYLLHLRQHKVSAELHVYERGGHGKGLQPRGYPFSQWTVPCRRWLDDHQPREEK